MMCVWGLLVLLCSATPGGSAATALLGVADGLGSAPPDVCAGHRCDSGACPCGCECGDRDDPGLCYVPGGRSLARWEENASTAASDTAGTTDTAAATDTADTGNEGGGLGRRARPPPRTWFCADRTGAFNLSDAVSIRKSLYWERFTPALMMSDSEDDDNWSVFSASDLIDQ